MNRATDLYVSKQTHAIIWAYFIIMMTQPGKSGTPSLLENLTPFFCGINGPRSDFPVTDNIDT